MPKQPNILLFCTDQMQSYCLGCNGHADVKTPNIDAIAAAGITFRRGYCNNNVCMPSRATMMTGLTPRGHGLLTNGNVLSEQVPTVGGALIDAGYRTHAVGKLHLQPFGQYDRENDTGYWECREAWESGKVERLPSPYYGFETVDFVGGHVSYAFGDYKRWLDRQDPALHDQLQRDQAYHRTGEAYRMDLPEELHYNHWIADRTIDFLQEAGGDKPFFLFCSFPDPHFPFAACQPYSEMYDPAALTLPENRDQGEEPCGFLQAMRDGAPRNTARGAAELREIMAQTYGMITHVDASIGRVMAALREEGLAENTVVGLIADHGEYLGSHNLLYKASWPYEELVRIPFVWSAPGATPKAGTVDDPVSLLDVVPTLIDYAGLDETTFDMRHTGKGKPAGLPGRSLRPYLEGQATEPAPALLEYDEDWIEGTPLARGRGLINGPWKLVRWGGFDRGVLFNLEEDPGEKENRWDDPGCLEIKCELLNTLADLLTRSDRFDAKRISGA